MHVVPTQVRHPLTYALDDVTPRLVLCSHVTPRPAKPSGTSKRWSVPLLTLHPPGWESMIWTGIRITSSKSPNLVGSTGRCYTFKKLIQERPHLGRVWLASFEHPLVTYALYYNLHSCRSENEAFILKDIPQNIFSAFNENIRPRLPQTPRIRLPSDTIPNQCIFVYKYLDFDFLSLIQNQIPVRARKEILKATLQGIADIHDCDIVHLGEPNHLTLYTVNIKN